MSGWLRVWIVITVIDALVGTIYARSWYVAASPTLTAALYPMALASVERFRVLRVKRRLR